jgi:hypothetical protein
VSEASAEVNIMFVSSNSDICIPLPLNILFTQILTKLCTCILFRYMFQNFHVELIPRATGNEYQNMQVIFKKEYLITASL